MSALAPARRRSTLLGLALVALVVGQAAVEAHDPAEPELDGARAAHLLAEQAHGGGGLAAGRTVQQRQVPAAGVDADLGEAGEQACGRRDDAQVGGQREVEPQEQLFVVAGAR